MKNNMLTVILLFTVLLAYLGFQKLLVPSTKTVDILVTLDREVEIEKNKALNSGTQSINRYNSILRDLPTAKFDYNSKKKELSITLINDKDQLFVKSIDIQYLVPLLPYAHDPNISDFDKANLLLSEYSRNGISLSYQDKNTAFGYFNGSPDLFNDEAEYRFENGKIKPNNQLRPKRLSVINNCLNPTLWEVSASDAVGEMYHSWFTLSKEVYFDMIKDQNNIHTEISELTSFIENNSALKGIELELNILRNKKEKLLDTKAVIAKDKILGGYSSQDSRRKVQRNFYHIKREQQIVNIKTFGELIPGDTFSLHSFVEPGIYNHNKRMDIVYRPNWEKVEIYTVKPKTTYGGDHDFFGDFGYIEIQLFSEDEKKSFVVGNIPVALLVFSEDYKISSFGAGVLSASEPIERRYLRIKEGPYPHYAYLTNEKNGTSFLLNNHTEGYEQIFLRPFEKNDQLFLRFTVVSYERIVDLLEFEIPIEGDLADRIRKASLSYKPPIYEVYQDSNVL